MQARRSEWIAVDGTRRLFDAVATDARLDAFAVQTVGAKHRDGFMLAVKK